MFVVERWIGEGKRFQWHALQPVDWGASRIWQERETSNLVLRKQ